jgi:predicted Zn-dependent protease
MSYQSAKYWLTIASLGVFIGVMAVAAPKILTKVDRETIDLGGYSQAKMLKEIEELQTLSIRHLSERRYPEAVSLLVKLDNYNSYNQWPSKQLAIVGDEIGYEKMSRLVLDKIKDQSNSESVDRVLGAAHFHANAIPEATKLLTKHLEKFPNDLPAIYYKAAILRSEGNNEECIRLLTDVIAQQPAYYFAYLELYQAYIATGNMVMAAKMDKLAAQNDPAINNNNAHCGLNPLAERKISDRVIDKI